MNDGGNVAMYKVRRRGEGKGKRMWEQGTRAHAMTLKAVTLGCIAVNQEEERGKI